MKVGINLSVTKDAVLALHSAINNILSFEHDNEVLLKALDVLENGTRITNVNISNCTFKSETPEEIGEQEL